MLHRSFKPAKCKTALKLAASRMKLLKNKKEALLKQMKRDLAQLLQSGQDRTALIRVEHVVREEKSLSAYELIEIYCELIVARLPIIESQKNCPIDLKEAIASVVFASPRCADVPELMDVRKQFTAKYGKEFTSAAVELRPDCGVGRMLIEKLSVKAPDGPTKIKILKSIAEEHDIKWDPSAENDPKPPEDLLNGSSTFEKASNMYMDPPNVQVRPDYDGRGQSSFHAPSSHAEKPDIHGNLYDHNRNSAQYARSDGPTNIPTNRASVSGTSNPEARPPGNGNEFGHSYSGNGGESSCGRQKWNMEFKDAAEAAQAAAESADQASMAARAAAELSGHVNVTRLSSPEARGPHGLRDGLPNRYSSSDFEDRHVAKDQVPKVQSKQSNETEQDNRSTDKSNQPSSSWASSLDDDDHMVNSSQVANVYSENNSFRHGRSNFAGQMSFDKPPSEGGFGSESEEQNDMTSENIDYPVEVRIRKESSMASSHSHSRTYSNDHDVLNPNNDAGENPFAEGNFHNDHNAPLVFDESGSDEEEEVLDAVSSKGHESSLFFSSPGKNSPTHLSTNINAWSPRLNVPHPVFTESSPVDDSLSDDLLPVTFDDYSGPSYESEEELEKSRHVRTTEVTTSISKHRSSFVEEEEESESDRKLLSQSFSNDDHSEVEGTSSALQPSRSSLARGEMKDNLNPSQVSDTITDTEVIEESSLESGSELSLGKLTGGLRNKGYRLPPYNRNASGNAFQSSSSPRVKNKVGSGAGLQESYDQNTRTQVNKKPSSRSSHAHFDHDSEEETLEQEDSSSHESIAGNQTSSSRSPPIYSGSDSDSGEDLPKQTATSKPGIGIGVSRRTKATVLSEKHVATDHDAEGIETSMEPHFETKNSFHIGDLDWARKMAEPVSKPLPDSNRPFPKERKVAEPVFKPLPESNKPYQKESKAQELVSKPFPESSRSSPRERRVVEPVSKPFPQSNRPSRGESLKSAAREQPSNSLPKNSSLSVTESQPKEKPNHVHPNLPDIDAITAHLQSLRSK